MSHIPLMMKKCERIHEVDRDKYCTWVMEYGVGVGEEVDNRSNKYSFSSSFPIDNSMFPVWCELLTVLSNSNEIGAAIHLQNQMSQTLRLLVKIHVIYTWILGGGGHPPKFFMGGVWPKLWNPYLTRDQILWLSIPFFGPKPKNWYSISDH